MKSIIAKRHEVKTLQSASLIQIRRPVVIRHSGIQGDKKLHLYDTKEQPTHWAIAALGKQEYWAAMNGNKMISGWTECPYVIGDTVALKEIWANCAFGDDYEYVYRNDQWDNLDIHWSPAARMPLEAARILVRVVNIRIERVQEISQEDARLSGVFAQPHRCPSGMDFCENGKFDSGARDCFRCAFRHYWLKTYRRSWGRNDWVFVYTVEKLEKE